MKKKLGMECIGSNSGSAEKLSEIIVASMCSSKVEHFLLFPSGNLTDNSLTTALGPKNVRIEQEPKLIILFAIMDSAE